MKNQLEILSLGAGVQSSALALMAARGEIGTIPDAAIFADTQDEPKGVYEWLDWLEKELPYPVYRVTRGKLSEAVTKMRTTKDGRKYSRTDVPFFTLNADGGQGKIKNRGCTADYKLQPIFKKCRELIGKEWMKEWRSENKAELKAVSLASKKKMSPPRWAWDKLQDTAPVIQWIGISLDEISRMKPSRVAWLKSRWPLIEMNKSRHDCLRWMEKNGYPEPPRSACTYCPFHSNAEWRRVRDDEPEDFQKAIDFERALQLAKKNRDNFDSIPFLHRSLVPLDQVDLSTDTERGQSLLWNQECEGMCGV